MGGLRRIDGKTVAAATLCRLVPQPLPELAAAETDDPFRSRGVVSGLVHDLADVDVLGAETRLAIVEVEFPQLSEALVEAERDNPVP